MRNKILLTIPLGCILFLVNECKQKEEFIVPDIPCRILTEDIPQFGLTDSLIYDNSGNITTDFEYVYNETTPYTYRTYTYRNGLVVSADGGLPINSGSHHEDWSYDGNRVVSILSIDTSSTNGQVRHYSISFMYSGPKLSGYKLVYDDKSFETGIYTYTGYNITIEKITFTDTKGVATVTALNTYSGYDDLLNTFPLEGRHLGRQSFMPSSFAPEVREISINNYSMKVSASDTAQVSYKYNAVGYPTEIATTDSFNKFPIVETFTYSNCN